MPITFEELREKISKLDEIYLLELLEIDSSMLVDRFSDVIENKRDTFEEEFDIEDEDESM